VLPDAYVRVLCTQRFHPNSLQQFTTILHGHHFASILPPVSKRGTTLVFQEFSECTEHNTCAHYSLPLICLLALRVEAPPPPRYFKQRVFRHLLLACTLPTVHWASAGVTGYPYTTHMKRSVCVHTCMYALMYVYVYDSDTRMHHGGLLSLQVYHSRS
jgi:hypothetical protein